MPIFPQVPLCSFCNLPVKLETSKTDEYGRAIHEACYLMRLNHTAPPSH
jgi:hypothetical protein